MTSRWLKGIVAIGLLASGSLVGLVDSPAGAAATPAWLHRVNVIRVDAGEMPVSADAGRIAGLRNHMTYLAKTPARLETGRYASAHTENPASAYYTKSGAEEAASSDLAFGTSSAGAALQAWLEAPFHAIGILRPALTTITFYRDPKTGDAGLDVINGLSGSTPSDAVFFPRNATSLSRDGGESPDPIQTCRHLHPHANYSRPGLPLVALLPGLSSTKGLSATVVQPNGRKITTSSTALCLVDARDYYSTDSVYGPTGKEILQGDNAVLLIPRTPLQRGKYQVHLHFGSRYHGPLRHWTFVRE